MLITLETHVRVPAKINLHLAVGPLRDDRYHEITTIFHTVSLFDDVTVVTTDENGRLGHPAGARHSRVRLSHNAGPEVPGDGSNLMVRAATALIAHVGYTAVPDSLAVGEQEDWPLLDLGVCKQIPVAAGMAGGSADAAGTLLALNRHWDLHLSLDTLASIGATLGADVPFCLYGGTALGTGTGSDVVPVATRSVFHFVAGTSNLSLATPAVYAAFDQLPPPQPHPVDEVLQAVTAGDVARLAEAMSNDLEPAAIALRPEIAHQLKAMERAGALRAMVSGSGPTILGLAEDAGHAQTIAQECAPLFKSTHVISSTLSGPYWPNQL
ncbi:4-(cytidine 5'-diphospho)-2-C-methyl-D-erythritol kinase [Stomatohabitans albus]|uniref:4-(cytidine 5'-diphospho)-2-C-methyl-D-erythritol kinase n=1 Tax=Stomatohabitans albus TaxID=3110766 RepID=UPI00300DAC1A